MRFQTSVKANYWHNFTISLTSVLLTIWTVNFETIPLVNMANDKFFFMLTHSFAVTLWYDNTNSNISSFNYKECTNNSLLQSEGPCGTLCNDSSYYFQMQFMLLFSRQGKLRLQKWYIAHPDKLKKKITRELVALVLSRKPKMCSFLEWKDLKVVYKRYSMCTIVLWWTVDE